jgi:hypothetical protein
MTVTLHELAMQGDPGDARVGGPGEQAEAPHAAAAVLPIAAGVLVPIGYDIGDEWELFGYNSAQVNEFAFASMKRRLKAIGVPLQAAEAAA